MKLPQSLSLLIMTSLLFTGCASKPPKKAFDLNANRNDQVQEYTYEYKINELKKYNKIILTNFVIELENELTKRGGSAYFGNSSKATIKLSGISDSTMQQLTNKYYDYVVKKLTEMGYEVITPDKIAKNKYYMELAEKAEKENPVKDWQSFNGESSIYSAYNHPFIMPIVSEMGKRSSSLTNAAKSLSIFSKPSNYKEQALADEEKIPVLKVWLSVGFGELKNGGSSSEATARLFVRGNGETRMAFRLPGESLNWGPFGGPNKDQPRDASHLINLTKDLASDENYLSDKIESGHSFAKMDFEIPADETKFVSIADTHLTAATDLLLLRLQTTVK